MNADERRESYVSVDPPARLEAEAARRPVAVLVTHGMGQQVRFETVNGVIEALRRAVEGDAASHGGPGRMPATVRMANLGGAPVPRVEVTIGGREAHFYEAYWAPVTEGKVSLRDVFAFLLLAGINGLRMAWQEHAFERLMFGKWHAMKQSHGTLVRLLLAVLTMLSLFALNSLAILAVGKERVFASNFAFNARSLHLVRDVALFGYGFYQIAAGVALGMLAGRLAPAANRVPPLSRFGFGLAIAGVLVIIGAGALTAWNLVHPARPSGFFEVLGGRVDAAAFFPAPGIWTLVWLAAGAVVAGLGARAVWHRRTVRRWQPLAYRLGIVMLLAVDAAGLGLFVVAWLRDRSHGDFPFAGYASILAALFCLLAVVAIPALRWFVVEYVGDVAAYISSHTVSKFDEVRKEIQKITYDLARLIYTQRAGDAYLYDTVALVGHSLGSVVAYDALDAMINEDHVTGAGWNVVDRTALLLTVSSPLDKTAFLFRSLRASPGDVREGLAEAKQPLIQSYHLRPRRWINLYSSLDWLGGPIRFYDAWPDDPGERALYEERKVHEQVDLAATTPLIAHTEVFAGREFGETLRREVFT